jgi:hypothetical protein
MIKHLNELPCISFNWGLCEYIKGYVCLNLQISSDEFCTSHLIKHQTKIYAARS